jgi:hypothetical protein
MVVDEFYCTPPTTILTIVFSANKTFLSHDLFNKDGKGPMEILKGEELDQTLLIFAPLCFPSICNLIVSLKHRLGNLGSIDYILKLKALSSYIFIQDSHFLSQ